MRLEGRPTGDTERGRGGGPPGAPGGGAGRTAAAGLQRRQQGWRCGGQGWSAGRCDAGIRASLMAPRRGAAKDAPGCPLESHLHGGGAAAFARLTLQKGLLLSRELGSGAGHGQGALQGGCGQRASAG